MLYVVFQLGNHRYALEASRVVEVVPLLALKHFPQAPRGMAAYGGVAAQEPGAPQSAAQLYAGILNYRGQAVPALDLCQLTLDRPAREHRSTRILIVRQNRAADDGQLIGLIAEHVTGTLRRDEKDFVDAGKQPGASPFLGPVLMDEQGVIQLLDAQKFLDEGGQRLVSAASAEAGQSDPVPPPDLPPNPGSLGEGAGGGRGPQNYAPH